jgi:hypothetical protein
MALGIPEHSRGYLVMMVLAGGVVVSGWMMIA